MVLAEVVLVEARHAAVIIAGVVSAVVVLAEVMLAEVEPAGMVLAELVFGVENRVDGLVARGIHLLFALVLDLGAMYLGPVGIVPFALVAAPYHTQFYL